MHVSQHYIIDNKELKIRPIKAEDEQLWLDFLNSCSSESVYSRFHYFFNYNSQDIAHNFCCLDEQNEIAYVAEIQEESKRKIVGIGRLIADENHDCAEFAIIVSDRWQRKHLGSYLTDFCIKKAQKWKIKKLLAYTCSDNVSMINLFRHKDFSIRIDKFTSDVIAEKQFKL